MSGKQEYDFMYVWS